MPLRDHFPTSKKKSTKWERVHGLWPGLIAVALNRLLPARYEAGPSVHRGAFVEVDVAAFENDEPDLPLVATNGFGGGTATAVWAPSRPTLTVATEPPASDEYEVRIYDQDEGERMVAAVEIVSPANKDRPDHRRKFVTKCAALLHNNVAVTIVDLVTSRRANLFRELLAELGRPEKSAVAKSSLYAVTCRYTEPKVDRWRFETWEEVLKVGKPLPTLPLWLSDDLAVPLELEATYEDTCRGLRIP